MADWIAKENNSALGFKITDSGRCICATDRGMVINERGECTCPTEHGYELRDGFCRIVPVTLRPDCFSDDDCANDKYCYLVNRTCQNPCAVKTCGTRAQCIATNHKAVCICPPGFVGDGEIGCTGE